MDRNPELLARLRAGENTEGILLEENRGLVISVAKHFLFSGTEMEDLIQIGSLGLLKAVRSFDGERGVKFSTYAVPVIAGEIKKYLRDNGPVKVSRSVREQYGRICRAGAEFEKREGRSPTLSELSAATGISEPELVFASDAGSRPVSLEESSGEEGGRTWGETIPDPDDGSARMEAYALRQCLSVLPTEDRKLISLRYFLNKTQQQTADELGMTQVQVSRREKKIMLLLREQLTS